jgi:hypothetical protein
VVSRHGTRSLMGGWGPGGEGCSIPAATTVTILPCNAPAARRPLRCDSPPLPVAQAAAAEEEASRQLSEGGASDDG